MIDEYQFKNNAKGQLASGINDSVTTLDVKAGEGAEFPTLTGNKYFMCTLVDSSGNREIIKVTARTTDSFDTIVRAQEGTAARAFSADDKVELRLTAGFLQDVSDLLSVGGGQDLNGEELILDADGDSSLHADTDDQLDLKLGGSDRLHFKTTVIEPTTTEVLSLGSSSKKLNEGHFKTLSLNQNVTLSSYKQAPSGSAGISFSGLDASIKFFKVTYHLTFSSDDRVRIRFNTDGGNNYDYIYSATDWNTASPGEVIGGLAATSSIYPAYVGIDVLGEILIRCINGDNTIALIDWTESWYKNANEFGHHKIMGRYDGAAQVTTLNLDTFGVATMTGEVILLEMG